MEIEQVKRKGKAHDALIESKDQRWHCRNRITLVFGSNDIEELDTYVYTDDKEVESESEVNAVVTEDAANELSEEVKKSSGLEFKKVLFHQAKSKAIEEILDNCIDEFYRGNVTEIHTTLADDGKTVIIEDNGIGFPLDKVASVYSEFRTGSKFKDDEVDENGFLYRTLGQNGLGAAATCLTSDIFKVRVRHYNSKKEQTVTFHDGALKTTKGKAIDFKGHSGVRVELILSEEVYKNNIIDRDLLRKRIIDLAYNNPGLTFYFNKERFCYKRGLLELAERIDKNNAYSFGDEEYVYERMGAKGTPVKGKINFSVAMVVQKNSEERERFISFVNSTPTFDGGFHHDKIKRIFINVVKDKLERSLKKEKITIVDNDILTGLTFIVGITMPNPRFESQTKRKLVRDADLEKGLESFLEQKMIKFLKHNQEYLDVALERARSRYRFQELKDAEKQAKKQKKKRIEKLLDANERKDRSNCTLFICEGDSAIGGLRSSRNKLLQGGIALKGKPMNVAQATVKDIINNQEFTDIMAAIGLTLGQPVDKEELRYTNIVFLADSDVDGGHINTLLANFFFSFWPEMFEMGMVQIAKAPLFEVITDNGTIFAESEKELEEIKTKNIKIKEIQRNKGLGEMSNESWRHVMEKDFYTKITIKDVSKAKETLNICFGRDTSLRKDLLLDKKLSNVNAVKEVSFNE